MPIRAINDFVVKFANVNGSGSASANEMFARSVLRMGVPVTARNIFPSNIQGLPTWYEVRVSGKGWVGRRGGVDMMVQMNPQTWDKDVASIDPGGYLFYDSSKPVPPSKFRDDVVAIGMKLTEIVNAAYKDARQRQLFKNIIYVGALSAVFGIDAEVVDLRTLFPMDEETVLESVAKTNKAILLHEATRTGGIGESLAAIIQEECFEDLDAPVRIVGALDAPVPYSPPLEDAFLAGEERVLRAARLLAAY